MDLEYIRHKNSHNTSYYFNGSKLFTYLAGEGIGEEGGQLV
jgi:hypothetical protein